MIYCEFFDEINNKDLEKLNWRKSELIIGEKCMRELIQILCIVKKSERILRDWGLVIRSRGRWGKCG
ncbi:hypothetical protein ACHQM5_004640 [Ranunculus cassubicifolius]